MVAVLNPGDKLGIAAPTDPGLVLGIQNGVKAWTSPRFRPDQQYLHSSDFGPYATTGNISYNSSGTGSGKGVAVGDTSTHPMGWGLLNKGTTTTGRTSATHSSSAVCIKWSSTSGTWIFECLTMIPTLSDATDTFACYWGFGETINNEDVDGAYFVLAGPGAPTFVCKTSASSVRTSTDSGITAVAGTWYRLKIIVTNDSQVQFLIGVEGSPLSVVATHTTNIPTGSGRETGWGIKLLGSAGTNAGRSVAYVWQYVERIPALAATNPPVARIFPGALNRGDGVGIPNGQEGYKLGVDTEGKLAWVPRQATNPVQLLDWFVMDKGVSREIFNESAGTGTTIAISSEAGYPVSTFGSTGSTATGRIARSMISSTILPTVVLSSSSGTFVFEALFKLLHTSDGTNTHTYRLGLLDVQNAAPANGTYFELNSNADPQFQCVTRANSTSTTTDSGVTFAADTWYWARIVITNNGQVQFYLGIQGQALALVATNTTNIPSGTGQSIALALSMIKSAGTTPHQTRWNYLQFYHLKAAA